MVLEEGNSYLNEEYGYTQIITSCLSNTVSSYHFFKKDNKAELYDQMATDTALEIYHS